ncbi:MAG: 6-carboxytetrahydropterin synthase [Planctomycetia bacterium]|nr:6-carboxytetrahydropterin synthase [Planctomycetia bacterium]
MALTEVTLDSDSLTFNAAHLLTFSGPVSSTGEAESVTVEPLHGHDFRVRVSLLGPLNDDKTVIDFIAFREILLALLLEFHHKTLLPRRNPFLTITTQGKNRIIKVAHKSQAGKTWSLPRTDSLLLPVVNVTTEELAMLLAKRLFKSLVDRNLLPHPDKDYWLTLELEESPGCSACVAVP